MILTSWLLSFSFLEPCAEPFCVFFAVVFLMLVGFLAPVSTVAVFVVIVEAMVAPVLAIEPTIDVLAMAVPDLSLAMVVLVVVVAMATALSWHAAMLTPAVV